MKASTAFEQQIHRIHELLEDSGAHVIWNDHIPDPDNPSQPRQIDVTIRRDGKLTLVECRDHESRQDVQWIEDLIGRRTSLRADATIAVSSSGFTAGALKKAKSYGIIPRDLRELTEHEVKDWGRHVALTLYFYQYSDLEVALCFKRESVPRLGVDKDALRSDIAPYLQSLFNVAAKRLDTLSLPDAENAAIAINFGFRLQLDAFRVAGETVLEVDFRGKAVLVSKEVISPAVFVYEVPEEDSMQQQVAVQTFALGRTSIVHDASRISVFLDVSQVEILPFRQFRFFRLTANDEVEHEAVELTGLDRLWFQSGRMKINICSI